MATVITENVFVNWVTKEKTARKDIVLIIVSETVCVTLNLLASAKKVTQE